MSISQPAKAFFRHIDKNVGPFDRPFQFRVFPFDAGGALNFLTVGAGRGDPFVTFVTWDLLGNEDQKRGSIGRYELMAVSDDGNWCLDVLTKIGRQGLQEVFEPGDTLDIGPWVAPYSPIQGVVFEEALCVELRVRLRRERCRLLRCVGITRPELEFAMKNDASALIECLKRAGMHPRTSLKRDSIELPI
jgi:hypothetical protein